MSSIYIEIQRPKQNYRHFDPEYRAGFRIFPPGGYDDQWNVYYDDGKGNGDAFGEAETLADALALIAEASVMRVNFGTAVDGFQGRSPIE